MNQLEWYMVKNYQLYFTNDSLEPQSTVYFKIV